MKSKLERRTQPIWQSVALAAFAAWALQPEAVAGGGSFGGGDTIGSHPGTAGDGTRAEVELRPVFFIEGPAELLFSDALHVAGQGEVTGVTAVNPDHLRLEFAPELTVRIDLDLLSDPRVSTGFRVAPRGGASKVVWDLGQHQSSVETLPSNATVELPVTRLQAAGVLADGLGFTTFNRLTGRTSYSVTNEAGFLVIRKR